MNEIQTIVESVQVGSPLSICYNYIKDNYNFKHNVITGQIEDHSKKLNGRYLELDDREINTIFLKMSAKNAKIISKDFIFAFLQSNYIPDYNPFTDFIHRHEEIDRRQQLIEDLANTIETDTPNAFKFIKHWGCGMIASIFGSQSPLTLVLAGEKLNTGKTEWFRRLLPEELKAYYTESALDGGKDDDILMTKKLIIMDDEFGGKSKKDQRHFKGLTSRQNMSIRVPYGKTTKDLRRICSLCGTSNELELLSDPYGNRRILPINVLSIDHEKYNAIDKNSLFMAFYDLYSTGFHWKFKTEDIKELNEASDKFHATNPEAELIFEFFDVPNNNNNAVEMTNTAIKDYIEMRTRQRLFNPTKLGIELKNLGFQQIQKKVNKTNQRVYRVILKKEPMTNNYPNPF